MLGYVRTPNLHEAAQKWVGQRVSENGSAAVGTVVSAHWQGPYLSSVKLTVDWDAPHDNEKSAYTDNEHVVIVRRNEHSD